MKTNWLLGAALSATALAFVASPASAATKFEFWYGLSGDLSERIQEMCKTFNESQADYEIVCVSQDNYDNNLQNTIAAFRANKQPTVTQIFDAGTLDLMLSDAYVPVRQLMDENGYKIDWSNYFSGIASYYSTSEGELLSMPFNSSTPVLYWNKELMQKAGLDPNTPPKTWPELGEMAKKAVAAGAKCGFTPQWQTWTMIENYGAWHNLPYATKDNGFGGTDIELKFNDPARVKFIQMLADWTKDKTFVYGGREGKSTALFTAGDCVFHIASSGSAAGIDKALGGTSKYGIGMMPYSPDVAPKPQNSIIGGATLWVLQGRPAAEYKGVAKFMSYLASTPVQAKWHQETGYVPITMAAAEATEKEGFYKKFPGREVAVQELTLNPPTANSKGLRIGNFVQIRDIVDGELENVWSGKKDAKTALDDAVKAGNEQLKRFEAANK